MLSTIATTRTEQRRRRAGRPCRNALVEGFQAAFWVGAAIAFAGVVAALVFIRREDLEEAPAAEAMPAFDAA